MSYPASGRIKNIRGKLRQLTQGLNKVISGWLTQRRQKALKNKTAALRLQKKAAQAAEQGQLSEALAKSVAEMARRWRRLVFKRGPAGRGTAVMLALPAQLKTVIVNSRRRFQSMAK